MPRGIHDAFDVAYRAGHLIGQGLAASTITGQGAPLLEAVGAVLQSCDQLAADGEGVLAKILREKAMAALHDDPDQTIDGTAREEERELVVAVGGPAGCSCARDLCRRNGRPWDPTCPVHGSGGGASPALPLPRRSVDHFTRTEEDAAAFHRMHGEDY